MENVSGIRKGRFWTWAQVFLAFVVLSQAGCAAVVYKDSATNYVSAGNAVIRAINDSDAALLKADNDAKALLIMTDRNCPIAEARVFVRDSKVRFGNLVPDYKPIQEKCKDLLACEKNRCVAACYSRTEGNCLVELEHYYTTALTVEKSKQKDEKHNDDPLVKSASEFAENLQTVEFNRKNVTPARVTAQTLVVLTTYMDLLGKICDKQTSDLETDAKGLNSRINTLYTEYSTLSCKQLTAVQQTNREVAEKKLNTLAKLAADIDEIAKNARDAAKIKTLVNDNRDLVDKAIEVLTPAASGDVLSATVAENLSIMQQRNMIEMRFKDEEHADVRLSLLHEMQSHPYATADEALRKVQNTFDSLKKSHNTLVKLVINPDDEQIKKIRNEEFQNFRTVAEDAAATFFLFK